MTAEEKTRMYHLICERLDGTWRRVMTLKPMPHSQACHLKSKFTPNKFTKFYLVEADLS